MGIDFYPIPLGVWRGRGKKEKKGERERLWEIKHIFFASSYCVVAVYETAKMLFAQPTDSISNSEEMFLFGMR